MPEPVAWAGADEGRHDPGASGEPWWQEAYEFRFWQPDGSVGGITCVTFLPAQRRAWYWAVLVRRGEPLLHVAQLDAPYPAGGLLLKAHGVWAEHVCEAPFEQWTVMNETYAVALDDPAEALGRSYGVQAPIAFDLEWYASAPGPAGLLPLGAADPPGLTGYREQGEVHGVVELAGGALELDGVPADRVHRWGVAPWVGGTSWGDAPPAGGVGLRAPVRVEGPGGASAALHQVLVPGEGWRTWLAP